MRVRAVFLDGTGRLRTVWRMLLFIVTVGIVALAVPLAVVLGASVLLPPVAHEAMEVQPLLVLLLVGPPLTAAALGVVFLFRILVDRRDVLSVGLCRPEGLSPVSPLAGVLFGLAATGLPVCALLAAGVLRVEGVAVSFVTVAAVPALAFGAFSEELIARGYLLRNMLDVRRPVLGVLVTALIFALAHLPNPHFLESPLGGANIFLAGVALGLAYMASGDLWFPTALHFGWNAAEGILFGLPISGIPAVGLVRTTPAEGVNPLLTGGDFGLEGSALATISTLVLIAALLALVRRRRGGDEPALTGPPDNS